MIGCGNNLFLVAPSTLRHVHADGTRRTAAWPTA